MRRRDPLISQVLHILLFTLFQMSTAAKKSAAPVESAALTDVSSQSDEAACFNFTIGNAHKKEFYSPGYPANYPKNTKCTLRITADVGHMVMLDFRDIFHLENSATCEYDRLEVRDGAYGYSPLIGQFCGNEFPSKIYSSKRYMWLHFSSDDSIEYDGFKAVYDYVPIPNHGQNGHDSDRECAYHRAGPSGIIEKTEIDPFWQKYRQEDTIECMWTIEAEAGKQIYINFNKYRLDRPNDCDQNFIQIFADGRTPDKLLAKFCGTTAEPQKSPSNVTHVRLFTHRDAFNGTDFTLHYTAFREIKKEEQCDPKTEFNCGDQTCVDIALKCDGEFDCKYRYDEEPSICARALGAGMVLTSEHMIIILVVFFSLVIAMCASISISCYNKIKERQLREREYKERRSKEASVEATIERRGHSADTPPQATLRGDDESSDGGCYVPDISVFGGRANNGETMPKKLRSSTMPQQYPYISESFESLESDVIVPPAPPPVPLHMKDRTPNYKIVGGKVVASTDSRAESGAATPAAETDPKTAWLRGEANRPAFTRSPGDLGLPKFGMSSRVTPDGPRGPLAAAKGDKALPLSAFRSPYESGYRLASNRGYPEDVQTTGDSSRAHSVASAPDALTRSVDHSHRIAHKN